MSSEQLADVLDRLAGAVRAAATTMNVNATHLEDTAQAIANQRRRDLRWGLSLFAVVLVAVLAVVINQRTLLDLSAQIRDCAVPTGECHQRDNRNAAAAIDNVNKVSAAAAWCAKTAGTFEELTGCIKVYSEQPPAVAAPPLEAKPGKP